MYLFRDKQTSECSWPEWCDPHGVVGPGKSGFLAIRGAGLPGGVVRSGVTLTKRQLAGRQRVSQCTIPAPVVLLWFSFCCGF